MCGQIYFRNVEEINDEPITLHPSSFFLFSLDLRLSFLISPFARLAVWLPLAAENLPPPSSPRPLGYLSSDSYARLVRVRIV